MAFDIKENDNNYILHEGVLKVKVIAINELDNVEYTKVNNGIKEAKIILTITNGKIKQFIWFGLADIPKKISTNTGTYEFIDVYGKSSWAKTKEQLPRHIDQTTARRALEGECTLTEFIKNWLVIPKGGHCRLDNLSALFNGDFSEIKDLLIRNEKKETYVFFHVYQGKDKDGNPKLKQRVSNKWNKWGWASLDDKEYKDSEDNIKVYIGVRNSFLEFKKSSNNDFIKNSPFEFKEYTEIKPDTIETVNNNYNDDDLPF